MKGTADEVAAVVCKHRFRVDDEEELQCCISEALFKYGVEHQREVRLNDRDRIDFLTTAGVGIEVKTKGSPTQIARQLSRYTESEQVKELLLITTKATHRARLPDELHGKPLYVLTLRNGAI